MHIGMRPCGSRINVEVVSSDENRVVTNWICGLGMFAALPLAVATVSPTKIFTCLTV